MQDAATRNDEDAIAAGGDGDAVYALTPTFVHAVIDALDIGDEYMIHGTLYERLLGYSVTHGCVRVGRDDLRTIVARVRPGTSVYIY